MEQKYALVPIENLEKIQLMLNEINEKLKSPSSISDKNLTDWITEEEAMELLKCKTTSLYNLRRSNKIIATKTRPVFYSLKSIQSYFVSNTNQKF
jgi:hypothetical protein